MVAHGYLIAGEKMTQLTDCIFSCPWKPEAILFMRRFSTLSGTH